MTIYNDSYCVYVHINKINGKIYVGQTMNQDHPNYRWNEGKGYKRCSLFWRAIQKYGWDNFEHEIIASNLTLDEANNFEELLIEKLDLRNPNKGYNLRSGGKNKKIAEETKIKISKAIKGKNNPFYGKHHTEEAKRKNREAHKDKHFSKEHRDKMSQSRKGKNNPRAKKVICIETNKIYNTITEASKEMNINKSHICDCCKGRLNKTGGYHWKYAD